MIQEYGLGIAALIFLNLIALYLAIFGRVKKTKRH